MKKFFVLGLLAVSMSGFVACSSQPSEDEKKALDSLSNQLDQAMQDLNKAVDTLNVSMDTTATQPAN